MGYTTKNEITMSEPKETTPLDAMVAGLKMLYDAMENPPAPPTDEEEETETKENRWIH
jgi:hypothetical protein